MLNRTIQKLFGSAAIILALGACGDGGTESENSNRGNLQFNYSGAETGSFEADGEFRRSAGTDVTFSAAIIDGDSISLIGNEARTNGRSDLFAVVIPDRRGTSTCDVDDFDCELFSFFAINVTEDFEDADTFFFGFSGTVNVTARTDNRLRGTFSLEMEDFEGVGSLRVRNGTFDVPILTDSDLGGTFNRAPAPAQLNRMRQLRARTQ